MSDKIVKIKSPTTYFEVAEQFGELSGWELANYNGVHNSVYDLNPGDTVNIPAITMPVPRDIPEVSPDLIVGDNPLEAAPFVAPEEVAPEEVAPEEVAPAPAADAPEEEPTA